MFRLGVFLPILAYLVSGNQDHQNVCSGEQCDADDTQLLQLTKKEPCICTDSDTSGRNLFQAGNVGRTGKCAKGVVGCCVSEMNLKCDWSPPPPPPPATGDHCLCTDFDKSGDNLFEPGTPGRKGTCEEGLEGCCTSAHNLRCDRHQPTTVLLDGGDQCFCTDFDKSGDNLYQPGTPGRQGTCAKGAVGCCTSQYNLKCDWTQATTPAPPAGHDQCFCTDFDKSGDNLYQPGTPGRQGTCAKGAVGCCTSQYHLKCDWTQATTPVPSSECVCTDEDKSGDNLYHPGTIGHHGACNKGEVGCCASQYNLKCDYSKTTIFCNPHTEPPQYCPDGSECQPCDDPDRCPCP